MNDTIQAVKISVIFQVKPVNKTLFQIFFFLPNVRTLIFEDYLNFFNYLT